MIDISKLSPERQAEYKAVLEGIERKTVTLAGLCEATLPFKLHDWQKKHLCPILERCRTGKGLRMAIHKPPQYGGSIIVSQRLAPWLWLDDPMHRFGLMAYNETHATGFGEVIRSIINSPDYQSLLHGDLGVKADAPAGRFFTRARRTGKDAQPSFIAMGLSTGFTGKGLDTLVIDDPYANAEDAFSETINEKVWRMYQSTVDVRIGDDANIIVMFHRYHEDDFAGRLLATGDYEYVRFPVIGDGEPDDPTGRQIGELLSPRRTQEWVDRQKAKDVGIFYGQFQGKPRPPEGNFIKREYIGISGQIPPLTRWLRVWDTALKAKESNDWWVGGLIGMGPYNTVYLRDVVRFKAEWPIACERMAEILVRDKLMSQREGWDYQMGIEESTASISAIQHFTTYALTEAIPLWPLHHHNKDLKSRVSGVVALGKQGKFILCGEWDKQAFITEALNFTGQPTDTDDQIAMLATGWELIQNLGGDLMQEEKPLNPMNLSDLEKMLGVDYNQYEDTERVFGGY